MRKGEIMGKIFGTALAILVILALALVQGAPVGVALAQSSPERDFETQPNTLVFKVCGSASPLVDVHTSSEVNMVVKYEIH